MELVLEQGAPQRLFHLAFPLGSGLPAVEANLLHDGVDVGHDALNDDVGVFPLHLVEQLGQCG